jgi:hypothetical protein
MVGFELAGDIESCLRYEDALAKGPGAQEGER